MCSSTSISRATYVYSLHGVLHLHYRPMQGDHDTLRWLGDVPIALLLLSVSFPFPSVCFGQILQAAVLRFCAVTAYW